MAFFDLSLDQLETYKPKRVEPDDFDIFWRGTLESARQHPLNATFTPIHNFLRTVEAFDVTYNGYGGKPIKGWLLLPAHRTEPLPCVVEYIGYGGGRGYATDRLLYSAAGYAHLIMDTRGQGSAWSTGDTPDYDAEPAPQFPGFMTRGILDPQTYYYRRVFTDAVRAVEAARSHSAVDPTRIAAVGGSQGGGITIAVAGLVPDLQAALPDVPFLCHYRRATQITTGHPYEEISKYLAVHRTRVETVFNTLSYFDGVNFATRAKARGLFSVGLMDEICPPSTVYAAYNYYAGEKEIRIWEYNHHEGGGTAHDQEKLAFLAQLWG